ncbi:MAG: recombinase family protein [Xanthobacteraceae bacterium]
MDDYDGPLLNGRPLLSRETVSSWFSAQVRALADELAAAGIKSKRRIHADGTEYGHQSFSHGALYLLLQNRTYLGEATHKGNSYPGEHAAIIAKSLWEAVQTAFAKNRVARATGSRTKQPSLLVGILFDQTGGRLTPTHCVKKGKRYRYYVSTALVTGATKGRSSRIRIPAGDLETVVLDRLRIFFANRAEIFDGIGHEPTSGMIQRNLSERAREIATELETQVGEKTKAVVTALVHRVEIRPDRVQIDISRSRLIALLTSRSMEMQIRDDSPTSSRGDILTLTAPAKLTRVGREMKMLVEGHNDQAAADPSLLRIIARAHDVQARLIADTKLSVHDVARQERVSAAYIYIYIILRLPWLAPDITTAIVNGRQPPQLNAKKLKRLTAQLPSDWAEQRALLGFR